MLSTAAIKKALNKLDEKTRWDLTQFSLDLIGIVDPTFIADGLNTVISLCRGDWFGAAVSGVSMLPAGDLAKILKLERYLKTMQTVVAKATSSPYFRAAIRPLMEKLSNMLNRLPVTDNTVVLRLRGEVKAVLSLPVAPTKFPSIGMLKHTNPDSVRALLKQNGFVEAKAGAVSFKEASTVNKTSAGPVEIWTKRSDDGGYFAVRIDSQGNATKTNKPGNFSIVSLVNNRYTATHGGRPHYHKEWVPESDYANYLLNKRPKDSSRNTFSYDDLGELSDDAADVHIPR